MADKPHSLSPETGGNQAPISLGSASGGDAIASAVVMGAAAGLSAILPATDDRREDLRGTCLYGDPTNLAITSPCYHVTVNLANENKDIVATTETNEKGEFRFYLPKGNTYFVQIFDRKGRSAFLNKSAGRGAVVSIFLKP